MQLDFAQRKRRPLSMTSLIDVIFLLLLFFMLSSTFSKYSEVEVSSARAGSGSSAEKPQLFVQIDKEQWRINGVPVSPEQVPTHLSVYEKPDGETVKAIIRVSEDVTAQSMVDAIEMLGAAKIQPTLVK
jgi:biopolymer transport protein ExbD